MMKREAFFLDGGGGRRFGLATWPAGVPVGGILYLHPFAEELNKSRRMAALAARAFAERGWLVLQIDGRGCGDSAGDFGEAGWGDWIDDMALGAAWLRARCAGPFVLWALRAGGLLACDWLARGGACAALLWWQPVASGAACLNQFLRLRAVNEMLDAADAGAVMKRLKADIAAGRAVEVAGYTLSARLAVGLSAAEWRPPGPSAPELAVFEVASGGRATPSSANVARVAQWRAVGGPASLAMVTGPAFWQTQEIEVAPALLDVSLRALDEFA